MSNVTNKGTVAEFDAKYGILDLNTPSNALMCGIYKQSFAYYTLRSRLPVTLTTVIDNITKDKDDLVLKFGENSREELKNIIGLISKLKYQLQTDKELEPFNGIEPDKEVWNHFINQLDIGKNSFFKTCWLYAECYMYRRLSSFFENSQTLTKYDHFAKQKQNALIISDDRIGEILHFLTKIDCTCDSFRLLLKEVVGSFQCYFVYIKLLSFVSYKQNRRKTTEYELLRQLNLWGNRCDLSITSGKEVQLDDNPFDLMPSYDNRILIDDSNSIIECLKTESSKKSVVELICDNAGYELFTDFVLADYLIKSNMIDKVRFNLKAIPWFVSDTTFNDFTWTLQYLQKHNISILQEYGKRWQQLLDENKFEIAPIDHFWTSPYEFYRMHDIRPDLYSRLSEARLIIFKGDLNYRKLIGDFAWNFTESFITCLRGFLPTNLTSLRTVKADLICGLLEGQAKSLFKTNRDWMTTGEYGTIQFVNKLAISK